MSLLDRVNRNSAAGQAAALAAPQIAVPWAAPHAATAVPPLPPAPAARPAPTPPTLAPAAAALPPPAAVAPRPLAGGQGATARDGADAPRGAGSPLQARSQLQRLGTGKPSALHAQHLALRTRVHQELVEELVELDVTSDEQVVAKLTELVAKVAGDMRMHLTRQDGLRLVETLSNDVLGLGPLEGLLSDPNITEVMINGPNDVYVEQAGKITLSPVTFESTEQLDQVIDRIVSSIGRRIDESSPMVDARLKDGSRVNVIIPPLALRGPTVTIRKFARDPFTIGNLVDFGSWTQEIVDFIAACVRARLNIIVSGGTGSGKTTTLNILSGFIPEYERIVTIEDAAELQLRQDHVVTLETRPPNVEGRGAVPIRDLVMNSLRMRPDRIIVGECRGGEALDMLQAMNTGHDGSLTTAHANSPSDCLSRLETMALMAGAELPSRAIREQIASAVNLIVQQSRMRDGTRKVVNVTEVLGFDGTSVQVQDIFVFTQTGVDEDGRVLGSHAATGVVPTFMEHLRASGENVDESIFQPLRPAMVGGEL